jgi:phosphoribosylformylglycinamidine synthase I
MKCAVVRFPGSNCDQDCVYALRDVFGIDAEYVWHKEPSIAGFDLIVLPGGFSYGDYLRCGAIARFSPVMRSVVAEAGKGTLVLGICNGFQILCEARLLPGALIRNRSLHFICEHRWLRVENADTPFTSVALEGALLNLPIAHGEGNYRADEETLRDLEANRRVVLRYVDVDGKPTEAANPNGSTGNIAGICNRAGNVFGLMPHPERACDPLLGSVDGRVIFESVRRTLDHAQVA